MKRVFHVFSILALLSAMLLASEMPNDIEASAGSIPRVASTMPVPRFARKSPANGDDALAALQAAPFLQQAKLTASDGAAADLLGTSVATDEDTLVVGSPGADSGKGAVYVFVKPGGGWQTTPIYAAKLTGSDSLAGDGFASSVSISGDTIVVGAWANDTGANYDRGAAYVFVKPGGGWTTATETAKLTSSGGATTQYFGCAVGISGDTIVIGAWWDDVRTGSAYVFIKPEGGWSGNLHENARLTSSTRPGDARFGISTAIDGDTIVIGAYWENVNGINNLGAAYVFVKPSGGWNGNLNETSRFVASDGTNPSGYGPLFGLAVSVSGNTIVVGAPWQDLGAVYVFVKPSGGWVSGTQTAKLTAFAPGDPRSLGWSVSISGEFIIAGAHGDDLVSNGTLNDVGSTYLFQKPVGGWVNGTETAKLTAADGASQDHFGNSVSIAGNTVVIGAYNADIGVNQDQGAAYIFSQIKPLPPIPTSCPGTWRTFVGSASEYDESRAITLDADCNVYVVGNSNASWGSPVDAYTGSTDAFVAKFNSGGVLQWNTFMGSSGVFDHGAGIAVDANGNVYVTGISIGASWGSPIDPFAGGFQAFVTKLNSSGVRQWNTFLGGPGESGDGYGIAVDGLGNVYVTGESRSDWGSSPIESYHGGREIFVAKLNTNGIRQWHTFLGSGAKDSGFDIALDDSGSIYVTAWSQGDFGSPRNPYAGDSDVAIVKLNSDGTRAWNTFMGSAGTDYGWGVAPDSNGNVYVSGYSDGTWGSPVTGNAGGWDGFAAKLNSSGDRQWNTFFGSTAEDQGFRMSIDGNGNTFVTGFSYETWGSPLSAFAGPRDAFLVKINSNGERIWNTFIGTAADDLGNDVAVDANGGAFVTGYSQSRWESGLKPEADESDGFITKLGATPTAATLTSFAARAANNRVVVKWATGSELQVIGFNVWRREANQSEFQKLNAALISAQNPGSVIGNSYSYNDLRVQEGTTYRYKLEIVETIGGSEWSGVVKVNVAEACAAAPDTPHLTTPRDGATVKQTRVKLKWETAPCAATYRVILRQSSPDGKKVDQATGLTKPQYKTIELQAGKTYYWHVRACNAKGCSEWSQWRTFNVPKGATNKSE